MNAPANRDSKKIVLLGDLADHLLLVRESGSQGANSAKEATYFGHLRAESKPLLPSMILAALRDGRQINDSEDCVIPSYSSRSNGKSTELHHVCGESISVLDLFPAGSTSKRSDRSTLRVKSEYRVTRAAGEQDDAENLFASVWTELLANAKQRSYASGQPEPSMLVLYDKNTAVRRAIMRGAPHARTDLADIIQRVQHGIVVGINGDLTDLKWIEALHDLIGKQRDKLIVQITADSLRKAGLKISRYDGLEVTVSDVFKCRARSPLKELLALTDRLSIVFRETGGLFIDNSSGTMSASLHYCPHFDRIAQSDPDNFGSVPGKFSIFMVSLVKEIYRAAHAPETHRRAWNIQNAVSLGAVAYNRLFTDGLGDHKQRDGSGDNKQAQFDPFVAIEQALSHASLMKIDAMLVQEKQDYKVTSLELRLNNGDVSDWRRTEALLDKGSTPKLDKLVEIVEDGLDAALKQDGAATDAKAPWFPSSQIKVPYVSFRELKLLDHSEIKNYFALAKVIRKYIGTRDWSTPLSIAVFGRPGSGKSFGVKQIVDAVDPGRRSAPLTFNLAQFDSVDQLTEAFHQIQDLALSNNEVPLAIFDEFDAFFKNHLGWLKFFLAPMQDGVFRGKTGDYKVGRAIFLFSGGTSYSYEEFVSGAEPDKRASKITDFSSRLRAHLDIMDINETEKMSPPSQETCLRRAVILRSLLEAHAKPIFVSYANGIKRARIQRDVVEAFLCQPLYLHGVRSMEAIIQMSQWLDGQFTATSLPSQDQLSVHVGAEFMPTPGTKPQQQAAADTDGAGPSEQIDAPDNNVRSTIKKDRNAPGAHAPG